MVCPNCGTQLEEFDTFCPGCGKQIEKGSDGTLRAIDTAAPVPESPAPKKVAKRLYPPEPQDDTPASDAAVSEPAEASTEAVQAASPSPDPPAEASRPDVPPKPASRTARSSKTKAPRWLVALTIVLAIVAAAAIGGFLYVMTHTDNLRVQAQKAQMEKSAAEATLADTESQLETLQEKYQTEKDNSDALSSQVDDLNSQLRDMKSSVSQAEYDKTAAQQELENTKDQMQSLSDSVADLTQQLEDANTELETAKSQQQALQDANNTLTQENAAYEDKVGFYDTYVVFVMLGSENKYYHKYDCKNFDKRNFVAYSTKLAEANGYSPCPICCGSN